MSAGDSSNTSSRPNGGRFTVVVQENDVMTREEENNTTSQLKVRSTEVQNESSLQTLGSKNILQPSGKIGKQAASQQFEIASFRDLPDVYKTVTSLASIGGVKNVYVNIGTKKPTYQNIDESTKSLFL